MEEAQLLEDLEKTIIRDGSQAISLSGEAAQEIITRAAALQLGWQRWAGIDLLKKARQAAEPLDLFNRPLANSLGGWAELIMQWSDLLQVVPPDVVLRDIETTLIEATEIDPGLADPFWDLAVIYARFVGDYQRSANYLVEAIQRGYQHPMIPRLVALIQGQPPLPALPEDGGYHMRQLVLRLFAQAAGPLYRLLSDEQEQLDLVSGQPIPGSLLTFGDYVREARTIVAQVDWDENQGAGLLQAIDGRELELEEFATDLLRRAAHEQASPEFCSWVTNRHLLLLVKMAYQAFGRRAEGGQWLRKARRMAQRGLDIAAQTPAGVLPDLHAELLLAKGQVAYYQEQPNLTLAINCYREALKFKRAANNQADVDRLKDLLWKQIEARAMQVVLPLNGLGETLDILQTCAETALEMDDPPRAMQVQLFQASGLRQIGRYGEAEAILRGLLQSAPLPVIDEQARFELASLLSETARPKEAAALQKELLAAPNALGPLEKAVLWSNYANSLLLQRDFAGAYTALTQAWELLPAEQKEHIDSTLPQQGARIKIQMADVQYQRGRIAEARQLVSEAEALSDLPLGLDAVHLNSIKARIILADGRPEQAVEALETAIHNLGFLLQQGPSLPSWESALAQWAHLDARLVNGYLRSAEEGRETRSLLRAEAAKGRILAWLENYVAPGSAGQALALERQEKALDCARQWLTKKAGRRIISLFGTESGLAVFHITIHPPAVAGAAQAEGVGAAWFDDFNYDRFRSDQYERWERAIVRATSGRPGPDGYQQASELTEALLRQIGNYFVQADPALIQGGSDLVILPHRALRNLPLAHAVLPDGSRLSDHFETITCLPGLGDFIRAETVSAGLPSALPAAALADADGSLAFARCEALLTGVQDRLYLGSAATAGAILEAFDQPAAVLLSLHGDFDEYNPWLSKIFAADGEFPLYRLFSGQKRVRSQAVILGVCEAGRSRHSTSDEPVGFPTLLLQAGAVQVLAPAWRVDDFASFLYMSRLFETLRSRDDLAYASLAASRWLRSLTAPAAVQRIQELFTQLEHSDANAQLTLQTIRPRLDAQIRWLQGLKPEQLPFASPLDWGAFLLFGLPTDTPIHSKDPDTA